jgi:hypothetical protein
MELEQEQPDEFEVDVSVNTNIPNIELSIGNNTVYISSEEAMQIAEALAEASGILEDLLEARGEAVSEPVDVDVHQAPDRLQ